MIRHCTILVFILAPLFCLGQFATVRGKVVDGDSKQPLSGISVYINGTTYSTQTIHDGTFSLSNIPFQSFDLTFSAINYETKLIQIDTTSTIQSLNITLKKNNALLEEVIVKTVVDNNDWSRYRSTFIKDFLSYSPFSKKCEIINYKDIKFRNNKTENILSAYCKKPIKIRNKSLGYEITYWLEEYTHHFSKQLVSFKGYTQFTEMKGSKKQQRQWQENRTMAYKGSLTHFIKSVYEGTTTKEGFIVNAIKTIQYKNIHHYVPSSTDSINYNAVMDSLSNIYKNNNDNKSEKTKITKLFQSFIETPSTPMISFTTKENESRLYAYFITKNNRKAGQYFFHKFEINDTSEVNSIYWQTATTVIPDIKEIQRIEGYSNISQLQKNNLPVKIFFTQPINTEDYLIKKDNKIYLQFADSWQITYTKEMQDKDYTIQNAPYKNNNTSYQVSVLSMSGNQPVRILPNGYYANTYSFVTGAYWSYEKMDKTLPIDYTPD